MAFLFSSPNLDPNLNLGLKRREMEMEDRINWIRLFILGFLVVFELLLGISSLGFDTLLLFYNFGTLAISLLWFFFVRYWANQSSHQPWLKYVTVLIDFALIVLIALEMEYLAEIGRMLRTMQIDQFELMMASLIVLFNLLSAFRQGPTVIYFSTICAMIAAAVILEHAHTDRTIELHEQIIILLSGALSLAISSYQVGTFSQLRQRERLMRYLSDELVEAVDKGKVELTPGGKRQHVTVLMADIRSFTSLCEQHSVEVITELLNRYFSAMTQEIFKQSGMVDKYIGDAIMAVFGAPNQSEYDAKSAILAAQGMLERLEKLNDELARDGLPRLEIGIGIHTGEVIAGNVGSDYRMDYTVVGDTVNVTARIESQCKPFNKTLLISEVTLNEAGMQHHFECVGQAELKGKSEAIALYSPISIISQNAA